MGMPNLPLRLEGLKARYLLNLNSRDLGPLRAQEFARHAADTRHIRYGIDPGLGPALDVGAPPGRPREAPVSARPVKDGRATRRRRWQRPVQAILDRAVPAMALVSGSAH